MWLHSYAKFENQVSCTCPKCTFKAGVLNNLFFNFDKKYNTSSEK